MIERCKRTFVFLFRSWHVVFSFLPYQLRSIVMQKLFQEKYILLRLNYTINCRFLRSKNTFSDQYIFHAHQHRRTRIKKYNEEKSLGGIRKKIIARTIRCTSTDEINFSIYYMTHAVCISHTHTNRFLCLVISSSPFTMFLFLRLIQNIALVVKFHQIPFLHKLRFAEKMPHKFLFWFSWQNHNLSI